ncbi:MAG: UvrD-helicase domain-containing protein, partial [Bacteroidales bacterium]
MDTFFQRIIRAFTHELGIPGNYNIEIETRPVVHYAVDSLIDTLKDNPSLLEWIVEFSMERIAEGKSWDFKPDLLSLGNEVFREEFSAESHRIFQIISDRKGLGDFRTALYKSINFTESELAGFAAAGIATIDSNGLEDADFYHKSTGIGPYLRKLQNKTIERPNSYVRKILEGPEFWPAGDSPNKDMVIRIAQEQLLPILNDIVAFLDKYYRHYLTCKVILRNLHTLGILSDLSDKVSQYRYSQNSFLLSDSPGFINKIINHNPAPFIYEKTGNRYNHFLIDEFQDTSQMQWKNMLPLIENSISQGHDCLLVGDVKQSVYRWRNSDWEILADEIHQDLGSEYLRFRDLQYNWRSCKTIVEFANDLFPSAIDVIEGAFEKVNNDFPEVHPGFRNMISGIYKGSEQISADQSGVTGHVKMRLFSRQSVSEDESILSDAFLSDIDQLLNSGYSPGDIAILVRGKKEGKYLADQLIRENSKGRFSTNVNVISDESLFLSSSGPVNILVAGLRYLVHPENDINRGKLVTGLKILRTHPEDDTGLSDFLFVPGMSTKDGALSFLPDELVNKTDTLLALPLYELAERLTAIFMPQLPEKDLAYIHAFLDLVHDYVQSNHSDIEKFLEYWEDEGNTKSVSSAESQNAIRILTIHKAKGLEFKVVMAPYCNWNLDQKTNTILWTKSPVKEFDILPLVPVNYSGKLAETYFSEFYYLEMLKSYIDNLNLLYVMLTRAEETLILYPHYNDSGLSGKRLSTVGDLISAVVKDRKLRNFGVNYDEAEEIFEAGEPVKRRSPGFVGDTETSILPSGGEPAINRLFFNPSGFEFLTETYKNAEQKRNRGKVLHEILSEITTIEDISGAVKRAIYKGYISQEESEEFIDHLQRSVRDHDVLRWFDGSGKIINETDIIVPKSGIRRPDRVVMFPECVDVIDYKSGTEASFNSHKKQMNE